jgi:hypothetical protein
VAPDWSLHFCLTIFPFIPTPQPEWPYWNVCGSLSLLCPMPSLVFTFLFFLE